MKPTDWETTVIKQMVVILIDPKRRACNTVEGPTREHQGGQETEGEGNIVCERLYCGFHEKEQKRQI